MKKILMITAAALTTVGLALLTGALIAADFDTAKLDSTRYQTDTYAVSENFDNIDINTDDTDIVLTPSEDGGCKVVCVARDKVKHSVSVENGTLKITETDTRKWYDHITMFSRATSVTVYLPPDRLESLHIDSGTGDVSVPASFTFGNVAIQASTGDIVLKASVDGQLTVKTTTGNITLNGVNAQQLDLSVSTGDILIQSLVCHETASIKVNTGNTRISDMTCRHLLTTGSTGDITLKNTVASGAFSVERNTGDVRFDNCDAEQITVRTSTGNVTGTLRSEKIFLSRSSTGSVHVPETTSGGKCKITTSSGDIDIRLK